MYLENNNNFSMTMNWVKRSLFQPKMINWAHEYGLKFKSLPLLIQAHGALTHPQFQNPCKTPS